MRGLNNLQCHEYFETFHEGLQKLRNARKLFLFQESEEFTV
jgi:hypothetical protein